METGTTPLEILLSRLWEEVLHKEVRDRNADFFALGGRPAEAEQLLALIEQRLHLRVESEVLSTSRTVNAFADALKHQVDHPGGLERLAERLLAQRLLPPDSRPVPPAAPGQRTGASW
jgi:hypothetical protein